MKKCLISSIILGLLLSFTGCGGGSSSSENTNSGNQTGGTTTDTTTSTTLPTKDGKVTFTRDYLKGKTLYLASPDDKDVASFVFGENSFSGEDIYRAISNVSYAITDKGYISFTEPDTNKTAYFKPISQDEDKISLAFSYDESSLANATQANKFFYFVKEKAVEYVKSIKTENPTTSDKSFKFSKEYLNGKTFYDAMYDDEKKIWQVAKMVFVDDTVHGEIIYNGNLNTPTSPYTITQEGYISFDWGYDDGVQLVKAIKKDDKKIDVRWEDAKWKDQVLLNTTEPNEYFYFSKEEAIAFAKLKN